MEVTDIAYIKSPGLIENIRRMESIRVRIHSLPLSREEELKFRWDTHFHRIYYSLSLYDLSVNRKNVGNALTLPETAFESTRERDIHDFDRALRAVEADWYVRPATARAEDATQLFRIAKRTRLSVKPEDFDRWLAFAQAEGEHPFIQAFLLQAIIWNAHPFTEYNEQLSHLAFWWILVKNGLDFRGLFLPESRYFHERVFFKEMIRSVFENGNATVWLDYAVEASCASLEETLDLIAHRSTRTGVSDEYYALSDRQRSLLALLDRPGATLSNRDVQKRFKVSQVTASRELARLVDLGLIFARGKGRSTVYART
jgi:DNA-binding transcriptional ArsR family regulator